MRYSRTRFVDSHAVTARDKVVAKGRLGPGQMIACNLVDGGFEDNWSIKHRVATRRSYGDWIRLHTKVGACGGVETRLAVSCARVAWAPAVAPRWSRGPPPEADSTMPRTCRSCCWRLVLTRWILLFS